MCSEGSLIRSAAWSADHGILHKSPRGPRTRSHPWMSCHRTSLPPPDAAEQSNRTTVRALQCDRRKAWAEPATTLSKRCSEKGCQSRFGAERCLTEDADTRLFLIDQAVYVNVIRLRLHTSASIVRNPFESLREDEFQHAASGPPERNVRRKIASLDHQSARPIGDDLRSCTRLIGRYRRAARSSRWKGQSASCAMRPIGARAQDGPSERGLAGPWLRGQPFAVLALVMHEGRPAAFTYLLAER